ncbi:TMV resistance protein N-like [Corylus avellana]|uniref:TMV resistance protein N-like n=1 Tax=Corylus avellana TaxID=13451 RepID=UPI00286ABC5E|nr:TMV resistance protein N-like [Corylus avellana]
MDQIVQEVVSRMAKLIPILDVAKYPVGIESRVKQINVLLRIEMNDRRMVGIFGPGGIGKTTIAKAVFNSIAYKFEGKCFLDNVRETSKLHNGLESLQEKLLFEILGDSSLKVHSVDRGVNVIKERLCNKNVLLVLDDVDDLTQLEKLSRECGWFGLGSRIIITTRDEHLLATHEVDLRHKMNDLDDNEALTLFSRHAFHSDKPNDGFVKLTKHALRYARGNPLALSVVDSGIEVLIDKSLITIDKGNLVMHDLVQDMGRKIVHNESPGEPGKRSRLWFHEDVRDVLEENMGTTNIKGILVDLPKRGLIQWRSNTFENMKRLKYFICHNAEFSEEPTYLPNELRVLDWTECPLQSLPPNFRGNKLATLRMRYGLFKEFQNFPNLSIMELIGLESLTEIPDISGIPNLQKLRVDECKSLVKVHDSVGLLKKLTDLHFFECSNLITLPRSLKLRSLETLWFHYCARIENFPKIDRKMERLEQLVLRGIAIKELPSSIVHLTGLFDLHIEDCKNLVHLPSSLQLQPLNNLRHERCSKVDKLPTKVRDERDSMPSDVSTEESEILLVSIKQ